MQKEIFKSGTLISIVLPVFIIIIMLSFYFAAGDMPFWVLLFLIIPVGFAIERQTTKLIIEDDRLRYQHGLFFKNHSEISLKQVNQIITRIIETWESDSEGGQTRRTEKITYVLDESGRTYFSFPSHLIDKKNRQRFEQLVTAVNSNIEVL